MRMHTILVFDDQATLLDLIDVTLKREAYKILTARTRQEVCELVRAHGDEIDLLIASEALCGESGAGMIDSVRQSLPNVKVLQISGLSSDKLDQEHNLAANASFLHKPFFPSVLADKVRELLTPKVRTSSAAHERAS